MQKCSASSLSTRIRIVMDKGWHGGNRIKSKKAIEDAGLCYLCGAEESQAHWLNHCPNISLSDARASARLDLKSKNSPRNPYQLQSAEPFSQFSIPPRNLNGYGPPTGQLPKYNN